MAIDPTKTPPPASAPAPAASETPPGATPPQGSSTPAPEPQAEAPAAPASSDPLVGELLTTAKVATFDELKTLVGTRIPDLMSKADTERNRADEAVRLAVGKDESWDVWIRGLANRGFTARQIVEALDRFKADAKATEQSKSASRSGALELINEAHRSGDHRFAEFLQTLADDTDGKLDRSKITRYRETFTKLTSGTAAPAAPASPNGNATAPAPAATRTPPATPGAGSNGPPGQPAWKGGDMSRTLLAHKGK